MEIKTAIFTNSNNILNIDTWALKRLTFDGEHILQEGKTSIGRAPDNNIVILSKYCSSHQCVIEIDQDGSGTITLDNLVNFVSVAKFLQRLPFTFCNFIFSNVRF